MRRRLKTRSGRDGIQAYLDDKKEFHANQKNVQKEYGLGGSSGPPELSEQGLVELQCPREQSAVERTLREDAERARMR